MSSGLDGGAVAPESLMVASPGVAHALFGLLARSGAVNPLKTGD